MPLRKRGKSARERRHYPLNRGRGGTAPNRGTWAWPNTRALKATCPLVMDYKLWLGVKPCPEATNDFFSLLSIGGIAAGDNLPRTMQQWNCVDTVLAYSFLVHRPQG